MVEEKTVIGVIKERIEELQYTRDITVRALKEAINGAKTTLVLYDTEQLKNDLVRVEERIEEASLIFEKVKRLENVEV